MQGWIKLHRKIMESPVWNEPGILKVWMYCLMKATHKNREVLIGQQVIELEPGQFITGRTVLADDYNRGVKPKDRVHETTVWRWLKTLEIMGNLHIKTHNKYSVVNIDKWAFYQGDEDDNAQEMHSRCTTDAQQMHTNKNVNKGNKKESSRKRIYEADDSYMKMAVYLQDKILEWKPNAKIPKDLNAWADEFRKTHELDERSKQEIKDVIDFATKDSFWQANILSAKSLREKFDQLQAKMKQKPTVKSLEEHKKQKEVERFNFTMQLQKWIDEGNDPSEFVYKQ